MDATKEYLRRNQLHASSIGVVSVARAAIKRVKNLKRPPKWLLKHLEAIHRRAEPLPKELAAHRKEVEAACKKEMSP